MNEVIKVDCSVCLYSFWRSCYDIMGIPTYFITVLALSASVNTQAWSWNSNDSNTQHPKQENPHTSKIIPEQNTNKKITNVELVIEAILSLKPQGNNTKEVDEVYRNMIRDKLCSLGLRNCELKTENNTSPAAKEQIRGESSSSNSGHKDGHIPSTHPHKKHHGPQRKQSSNFSGSSQHFGYFYKPQYGGYKMPQKHIHHHFHYNNQQVQLATESNGAQTVTKTSSSYRSTNQLGSKSHDSFSGYSLGTTSSTLEATLGSTVLSMQSTRLDESENFDCTCVPYGQCPTHVLDENENQQLPLDPRRLKRDMHGPQKAEISILIDNQGKMHFIRVPSKASLNIINQEGSRTKREPPQKKPEVKIFGHPKTCGPKEVCCKKSLQPKNPAPFSGQCGTRNPEGITGRIKNPVQVEGDSDFGEYPWQVAILKRGPEESGFICGGTLIDSLHIITAAHCVRRYTAEDLKVRLGEWEVNHDTEFFSYVESDISTLVVHPNFYAGTLHNDLAILRMEKPVDLKENPHISPACLPSPHEDFTGATCWTTGWGKDAFGENGKYQNILQEIDVPIVDHEQCQTQLQNTRLGHRFKLHPGFICAGGEGKDACKGDGGGPMVCERGGIWSAVGIVSWGIGCGQIGIPGVYVKVSHYLDWIEHNTQQF